MSNEQINDLINCIGAMTEMWSVSYDSFKNMGMTEKSALEHTREFMTCFIACTFNSAKKDEGKGE